MLFFKKRKKSIKSSFLLIYNKNSNIISYICIYANKLALQMINDKELLNELGKGELSAYDSLYVTYSARVREFAFRLTKNMEEAEDITHNIFLKVWEEKEEISKVDSFKSYLFTMTKNLIFNSFKKNNLKLKYKQSVNYFQNEEMDSRIYANDLDILIALAIEKMPEERKQIFKMSRYEEMSYKEIADKLTISPKTVQYHISHALSDLRKVMTLISIFF